MRWSHLCLEFRRVLFRSASTARSATSLPAAPGFAVTGRAILTAATLILPDLERGRAIDARALRAAMETAFHGSDADGAWDWKTAYDACEAAQLLFLRDRKRVV